MTLEPSLSVPAMLIEVPFVGRERELELLERAAEGAVAGRGQLVLVAGEAGIGKTRLVDELVARVVPRGMRIARGRCWEGGGAPAYWPWVQVLRSCLGGVDRARLAPAQLVALEQVAELIPEAAPPGGRSAERVTEAVGIDPDRARFALFEAVSLVLRALSDPAPLLVELEDVHAADVSSLLLLRFVANELCDARVLLVATQRDAVAGLSADVRRALVDLAREGLGLALEGLGATEVSRLLEAHTGSSSDPSEQAALVQRTGGNPFFLDEILRARAAGRAVGAPAGSDGHDVPGRVREVIGRRLEVLADDSRDVLEAAAVSGNDIDPALLSSVIDGGGRAVREALRAARGAGLVVVDSGGHGCFRHALVRESLLADLPTRKAAMLHLRIGEALERLHASDPEPRLAELAHHFREGFYGGGDPERAITYARRAGARALRLLAYEDAWAQFAAALDVLGLSSGSVAKDEHVRCELLLDLGDAQSRSGDASASRATFEQAFRVAGAIGAADLLARAALGAGGGWFFMVEVGRHDAVLVDLLERALAALGDAEPGLRARLASRLAVELYYSEAHERRDATGALAVDLARVDGHPATLARALLARFVAIWGPDSAAERLALTAEALDLADRATDPDAALAARWARAITLLELGRVPEFDAEVAILGREADEARLPSWLWLAALAEACRLLVHGSFDRVEEVVRRSLGHGQRAQPRNSQLGFAVQMALLRREQERFPEIEGLLKSLASDYPTIPGYRLALGLLHAELGRTQEARTALDAFVAVGLVGRSRDARWLSAAILAAEISVATEGSPHAAALFDALLPYADLCATASFVGVAFGSVHRLLGALACRLGRFDVAEQHLATSIAANEAMGARPWLAYSHLAMAEMLLARAARGDRERAGPHLERARAIASEAGMTRLLAVVGRIDARATGADGGVRDASVGGAAAATPGAAFPTANQATPAPGPGRASSPTGDYVLRREGEAWQVRYRHESCRLKDSKGLVCLARLLASPGQEFHAIELVAPACDEVTTVGGERGEPPAVGTGGKDEALDPAARVAIRQKLADLDEALEEARELGDALRAERLEEEIDRLARRVAATLGGQRSDVQERGERSDRRAGTPGEKARLNVTRTIKAVLDKLASSSPELAAHLRRTVRTGAFCSYTPDPRVPILWEV